MDIKNLGAIGAVVAGVLAVGSNLTSILSFFGFSSNENNVNVTVNIDSASLGVQTEINKSSAKEVITAETVSENAAETVTEIKTESVTEGQTEPVTEIPTEPVTEKVEQSDEIKAESNFELVNIATFSDEEVFSGGFGSKEDYHWDYYSGFADYDPNSDTIYYVDSVYTIKSYNLKSGEEKTVADFSEKFDEIEGLAVFVNHSTGDVYSAFEYDLDGRYYNDGIYDISNDKWIIESDYYFSHRNCLRFLDNDNILSCADYGRDLYLYSLKKEQSEEIWETYTFFNDDENVDGAYVHYMCPFLYDDCWYYFGHTSYGGDFTAFIAKTVQLKAEKSSDTQVLANTNDILSYYVGEDGVCYLDKDHNIYQLNMQAEHKENTLLSDGANPDILLVKGENIKNTASSSLSEPASYMIKINNSSFVFYDCSDDTLKLLKVSE